MKTSAPQPKDIDLRASILAYPGARKWFREDTLLRTPDDIVEQIARQLGIVVPPMLPAWRLLDRSTSNGE